MRSLARARRQNDELQLDLFSASLPARELVAASNAEIDLARVSSIASLPESKPEIVLLAPAPAVQIETQPETPAPSPLRNQRNYRITDDDEIGKGSLKSKCHGNLSAIQWLKEIESTKCNPSDDERRILVRYVGWGGLPQVFSEQNKEWKAERERLRDLLTDAEFDSARATTLNAHYTSPAAIRAMYAALKRIGFEHGRILEPACGLGHFIGLMPDEMHSRSEITGVEIDSITARIARLLYPNAEIRHQPFEESKLVDGSFDLAISNIPFGDYKPFDRRFKKWNFVIHDYFFAAALASVRPGGLILFITSKGTLDKVDGALRAYVAAQADLLGALRLPNDAFKRNAHTEVTTDIVMLRKRMPGEGPHGPAWQSLAPFENSAGESFFINEYFAAHPEMMLGEMQLSGRMYGRGEPTLAGNGRDLAEQLVEAVARLPEGIYRSEHRVIVPLREPQTVPAPEHVKPNAYALVNGQIARREGNEMRMLDGLSASTAQRLRGLIRVRDTVRRCLRVQLENEEESAVIVAREQLNQTYDHFTAKFGFLSERANVGAFRGDPDLPLLLSLEHYDAEARRATKAAIFRERTLQRTRPPRRVESARDALLVALSERGRVDVEYMGQLLHRPADEFLAELRGTIFLNPATRRWETEDEYLSGNVRDKLRVAEAAAVADAEFSRHVEVLRTVQPVDLRPDEIDARLGGTWIPAEDIQRFASELLNENDVKVSHAPQAGLWSVRGGWSAKSSVANTTEWGTDRASALELLDDALNLRTPTIYDYDEREDRNVLNGPATEAARDKQEKIKERFKAWIWQDEERRERLARVYNEEFNSVRLRTFSGEHLTLPGASAAITLHSHQKAGVWRILQTPNCLLAHVVGAGIMPTAGSCRVELRSR